MKLQSRNKRKEKPYHDEDYEQNRKKRKMRTLNDDEHYGDKFEKRKKRKDFDIDELKRWE